MDVIVELLKIIVGLLVIAACIQYWWDGFPPRGRGRWRRVLSSLEGRDSPGTSRRRTSKTGSTPDRRSARMRKKAPDPVGVV